MGASGITLSEAVIVQRPNGNADRAQDDSKRKENPVRIRGAPVLFHRSLVNRRRSATRCSLRRQKRTRVRYRNVRLKGRAQTNQESGRRRLRSYLRTIASI